MDENEQRAFDVAHRDFIHRVERASDYRVSVICAQSGYTVTYERQIRPGEPMVLGGEASGVTYAIDRAFQIENVSPR